MQSEYQYTHHPASQTFPNFHHGHQVPAFMNQQIPYYLHPHQVQSESWHQAQNPSWSSNIGQTLMQSEQDISGQGVFQNQIDAENQDGQSDLATLDSSQNDSLKTEANLQSGIYEFDHEEAVNQQISQESKQKIALSRPNQQQMQKLVGFHQAQQITSEYFREL